MQAEKKEEEERTFTPVMAICRDMQGARCI